MSGPKRNPDRLNTIGIVVVGICGAVLVYVSIVALQAFYLGDTSEIQMMADYGGQDSTFKSLRSSQISSITEMKPNTLDKKPGAVQTYAIPIDHAMKLVVRDAKTQPSNLVPAIGPADKPTLDVPPVGPDGRLPRVMATPAPAAGSGSGSAAPAAGSAAPAGSAAGSAAGSTTGPSPTPTQGVTVTPTPTGGTGPGGGTAPQPSEKTEASPTRPNSTVEPKGATPTDTKTAPKAPAGGTKGSAAKGNGR